MRYLVGVVVGAIIGYLTNWLAIKMLFRPYTEKRIFGVKVPFTPGLIPKEKDRIARNVSESVGEHLLNRESIGKALKEPEVKIKVKESIENKVEELLSAKGTIRERANDLFGEKVDEMTIQLETTVKKKIFATIQEKTENKTVLNFVFNEVKEKLSEKPELVLSFLDNVSMEKLSEQIIKVIPKEELYNIIENNIKDKIGELEEEKAVIGDLLPEGVFQAVDNYIINHKEEICLEICRTLRKDDVSYRIKEKIEEHLFSGLKGIVTMFLSVDLVYDKMVGALEAYLVDERNQMIICKCITNYVNGFADIKFEDFIDNMPANLNRKISMIITDKGTELVLKTDNLNKAKGFIANYIGKFDSYDALIKSVDSKYEEKLKEKLDIVINNIINGEKLNVLVENSVSYVKEEILDYDFSNDIEKSKAAKILAAELIEKNYDKIIDREIPQILEIVNIPNIVENQINSFEVDYAEQLIVNIANKELKAITWLGALLGGVLGILSPIIGSIKF